MRLPLAITSPLPAGEGKGRRGDVRRRRRDVAPRVFTFGWLRPYESVMSADHHTQAYPTLESFEALPATHFFFLQRSGRPLTPCLLPGAEGE